MESRSSVFLTIWGKILKASADVNAPSDSFPQKSEVFLNDTAAPPN